MSWRNFRFKANQFLYSNVTEVFASFRVDYKILELFLSNKKKVVHKLGRT